MAALPCTFRPASQENTSAPDILACTPPLSFSPFLAVSGAAPLTDGSVVYGFDVALLCILAVFFLASIPRALARFSIVSEWGSGLVLRAGVPSVASTRRRPSVRRPASPEADEKQSPDGGFEYPPTFDAPSQESSGSSHQSTEKRPVYRFAPPKYVSSWSTRAYPVSSFFSKSISPGTSFGEGFLLSMYLLGVIVVTFLSSNPITKPDRVGFLAVSQIPVAVAFGTKNSIPGILLGAGYVKVSCAPFLCSEFV